MSGGGSRFTRALTAELLKLRGLPAAVIATLGTIALAPVLAAALSASTPDEASAAQVLGGLVPFLQIGPILLGVLAAASEYAGGQIRTSLVAVPGRSTLLAAKALALVMVATATGIASVGAAALAAGVFDPLPLLGAVAYLAAMGLLALLLAMLLRSLIPPLAGLLALVLIASPLLASITEHARWLPDRAGASLYATEGVTPLVGALTMLAWLGAAGAAATVGFLRHDA